MNTQPVLSYIDAQLVKSTGAVADVHGAHNLPQAPHHHAVEGDPQKDDARLENIRVIVRSDGSVERWQTELEFLEDSEGGIRVSGGPSIRRWRRSAGRLRDDSANVNALLTRIRRMT